MLQPDSGLLELGAIASPDRLAARAEYLHRIGEGLSIGAGGEFAGRDDWRAEGFIRYVW